MKPKEQELLQLLNTFDVPIFRKEINLMNLNWLAHNLFIRNCQNPNFNKAMELIRQLFKEYKED